MSGRKISEETVHIVPNAETRFIVAKGTQGGYITLADIESTIVYSPYYGVDLEDGTYVYAGFKKVGSPAWKIKRVRRSDYEVKWALGETGGQAAWDDRYNLEYGDL